MDLAEASCSTLMEWVPSAAPLDVDTVRTDESEDVLVLAKNSASVSMLSSVVWRDTRAVLSLVKHSCLLTQVCFQDCSLVILVCSTATSLEINWLKSVPLPRPVKLTWLVDVTGV